VSFGLPSLGELGHPALGWLAVALAAELASLLAYALVAQRLLVVAGVPGRLRTLLRTTVGGIAIGASIPGGAAVSTAYWYTQLRALGAVRKSAALVLAGTTAAGAMSLGVLAVAGVVVAGGSGPLGGLQTPILASTAVLAALALCFRRRLRAPSLGRSDLAAIGGFASLNWLLDCVTLVAALAAVHAHVPAQSILLTYALAQIAGSVPLLPGGAGAVEVSLSLGFAAFGHTSGNVLAGVLLYRLISCWGLVPLGWLAVTSAGVRRLRPATPRVCAQ
jgi:uncharacterized membrane protein YbhN (UPF0104 family)